MSQESRLRLKEDLIPVSTLQAKTSPVLRELEANGRCKVITREGVAVGVLVGVDEFERLQEDAAVGRLLRDIGRAEAELAAGEGIPHDELEREFAARWGEGRL